MSSNLGDTFIRKGFTSGTSILIEISFIPNNRCGDTLDANQKKKNLNNGKKVSVKEASDNSDGKQVV